MPLSHGLHREAGEVFAQLLDAGAKPAVQDRARFFLAKIRYQRGLLPEALDALGKIGSHLPPPALRRSALLHAIVLLAGQDYAGAAQQLRSLTGAKTKPRCEPLCPLQPRRGPGPQRRRGCWPRGSDELGSVARSSFPATPEYRALRDQANLALGFALLRDEQAEEEAGYLQRVRLRARSPARPCWAMVGAGGGQEAPRGPGALAGAAAPRCARRRRAGGPLAVPLSRGVGRVGPGVTRYQEAIALYGQESALLTSPSPPSVPAVDRGRPAGRQSTATRAPR